MPVLERFLHGRTRRRATPSNTGFSWQPTTASHSSDSALFCVGVRSDLLDVARTTSGTFDWPSPTHSGPHETRTGWDEALPRHVSSGDALSGLLEQSRRSPRSTSPAHTPRSCAAVPARRELPLLDRGARPSRATVQVALALLELPVEARPQSRPSPTIQGQPGPWVGPFHWDSRRLACRRAQAPDDVPR